MSNDYYNRSNAPATSSALSSATIRAEFAAIEVALDKVAPLTGNGDEVVVINVGATGQSSLPKATLLADTVTAATSKATPIDADTIPVNDSASSYTLKKLTFANLKATLKTYFDTVATTLTNKTLTSPVLSNPSYSGTTANGGAVTTIDINGGTIDGTPIGSTTPSTGAFTTLSASGAITAQNGVIFGASGVASGTAVFKRSSDGLTVGTVNVDSVNSQFDISTAYSYLQLSTDSGEKALLGPTGLAVTGALSATTNLASDHRIDLSNTDTGAAAYITQSYLRLSVGGSAIGGLKSANTPLAGLSTKALYLTTEGNYPIAFGVNNSATPVAVLDTSGNLGLGVTPSAWGAGLKAVQIGERTAVYDGGANSFVVNNYYNDGTNYRYIATAAASDYYQSAGAHVFRTAPSGTAGNPISFTQAMTLDASGNLLVGKTTQGVGEIGGEISPNAGSTYIGLNHATGTSSGNWYVNFAYASGVIGSITQSGTTAVLYNTTSDARLKTNIAPAADAASLIDAIQVRQFDWLSDGSHQRYGFVAQELYEVAPEAVSKPQDPAEMMAVDYSKLVPMLVKEIQSLRARVDQLEGI